MRKLATLLLAAGLATGLAACSESVDREGTVDELVDSGAFNREQAECLVDRLIDEFGEDRALELNDPDEQMTAEEEQKSAEITTECLGVDFSVPDISIPDISIPDISIPDISIPDVEE